MVVLDASVVVSLLVNDEPRAGRIRARLKGEESFHAPHLLDVEVLSALRQLAHRQEITASQANLALTLLPQVRLTLYPHLAFRERIWALRYAMTAYDAAYVALAEALNAPLLTLDGKLAKAPGHYARVEHLGAA